MPNCVRILTRSPNVEQGSRPRKGVSPTRMDNMYLWKHQQHTRLASGVGDETKIKVVFYLSIIISFNKH